jgi:hypothetical protein
MNSTKRGKRHNLGLSETCGSVYAVMGPVMSFSYTARSRFARPRVGTRRALIANAHVWARIMEQGNREDAGMRSTKHLPSRGASRGTPAAWCDAVLSNWSFDTDAQVRPAASRPVHLRAGQVRR